LGIEALERLSNADVLRRQARVPAIGDDLVSSFQMPRGGGSVEERRRTQITGEPCAEGSEPVWIAGKLDGEIEV